MDLYLLNVFENSKKNNHAFTYIWHIFTRIEEREVFVKIS